MKLRQTFGQQRRLRSTIIWTSKRISEFSLLVLASGDYYSQFVYFKVAFASPIKYSLWTKLVASEEHGGGINILA
jgi:hypothetical protein